MRQLFLILIVLLSTPLYAVLEVVVLKGARNSIPVAVLPFYISDSQNKVGIASIIEKNLVRSGYFNAAGSAITAGTKEVLNEVDFEKWQQHNIEILVFGGVEEISTNFWAISVYVYEIYSKKAILAYRYRAAKQAKRRISHQISDKIYQAVLGIKGDFDTYLTFVEVDKISPSKKQYYIRISDSDGVGGRTLFTSSEPLLSPTWSPDNQRIAYVSFENGRSEVFIRYPFLRRKTQKLPTFDGIASAPSWHPDGDKLLLTLSKEGNKDIYLYRLKSGRLERLTKHKGIDTEASFSPDGQRIVFTSNRNGEAQIYIQELATRKIRRLSFQGRYNTSAKFSPDGKSLVILTSTKKQYHIALFDLASGQETIMTENILD